MARVVGARRSSSRNRSRRSWIKSRTWSYSVGAGAGVGVGTPGGGEKVMPLCHSLLSAAATSSNLHCYGNAMPEQCTTRAICTAIAITHCHSDMLCHSNIAQPWHSRMGPQQSRLCSSAHMLLLPGGKNLTVIHIFTSFSPFQSNQIKIAFNPLGFGGSLIWAGCYNPESTDWS